MYIDSEEFERVLTLQVGKLISSFIEPLKGSGFLSPFTPIFTEMTEKNKAPYLTVCLF
jgi:hypothetical protein